MENKFTRISLTRYFNSNCHLRPGKVRARGWHKRIADVRSDLIRGRQTLWGIPFALGPQNLAKKGLIVIGDKQAEVEVPLRGRATHVCVLHFCNLPRDPYENAAGGTKFAEYELRYGDGRKRVQPIRIRFEVNPFSVEWGWAPFAAVGAEMPTVASPEDDIPWGHLQTGVMPHGRTARTWVYALPNPKPEKELSSITFRSCGNNLVAILSLTLYDGPGHPLRHVPRRVYKLILPPDEKCAAEEVKAELDMGVVTRVFAVPGYTRQEWLEATKRGLGAPRPGSSAKRQVLVEATGAEGATLAVRSHRRKEHKIPFGEAFTKGKAKSTDGRARLELVHPRKAWVYVTVIDGSTDKPTPTRAHFHGPAGEYIPPYGHHAVVNDNWFEDYGGDLLLGEMSYAYVPGRFQIELPVGKVHIELCKGFEYVPLRKSVTIRPGQRELKLEIKRWTDKRSEGWVTADTHVHFISPETAWLEGQGEGLNLINLLASQWGRLFTNVADISGDLSGSSRDDTLVWVGTENRNHMLGHISMLGAHGDPVFPMCAGGPGEAYLGDPDVTTLTEWAQTCRERDGVVIRPHFPAPICEEPVYFILDELDGAELRMYAPGSAPTLDTFVFKEWYRYLNCGHRVAAVGGTIVVNGNVVARRSSAKGVRKLSIKKQVSVKGSCWIAARCSSNLMVHHCWPIHLGAHTSPVYVVAGGEELFSPSDASYMLTLIDGGLTYLDTLSVRFDAKRHRQLKAVYQKARRMLLDRMHAHGHSHAGAHSHGHV